MRDLKKPKLDGGSFPKSSALVPSYPELLAFSNIYFFRELLSSIYYFTFSSIFSQILGTPKNIVGLTSCKVFTSVPYKAVTSAKYTVPA